MITLQPPERWHGTWFVTCYALVIFSLIAFGYLPTELIPYFFLDYLHTPWPVVVFAFFFVYSCAYLMAWALSEWNSHLSWLWFRKIAG